MLLRTGYAGYVAEDWLCCSGLAMLLRTGYVAEVEDWLRLLCC